MSGKTIRTKIYIFYLILIPFSILAWVFVMIAIAWSTAQIYSCTGGDCINLVRTAILNLILSGFVIGCGVIVYPFIWYMVRTVTRNALQGYRDVDRVNSRIRVRSSEIRDSLLPSYTTATGMRNDNIEISYRSLRDASLLADGYSVRD